ncbi:hypothetical protein D3C72_1231460 [compost metagenome]
MRVSTKLTGPLTRITPRRWNRLSYKASEPDSELVWLSASSAPICDTPVFNAMIGVPCCNALQAARAKPGTFFRPSRCRPMAVTRGSSSSTSISSATPSCAWLPTEAM